MLLVDMTFLVDVDVVVETPVLLMQINKTLELLKCSVSLTDSDGFAARVLGQFVIDSSKDFKDKDWFSALPGNELIVKHAIARELAELFEQELGELEVDFDCVALGDDQANHSPQPTTVVALSVTPTNHHARA